VDGCEVNVFQGLALEGVPYTSWISFKGYYVGR